MQRLIVTGYDGVTYETRAKVRQGHGYGSDSFLPLLDAPDNNDNSSNDQRSALKYDDVLRENFYRCYCYTWFSLQPDYLHLEDARVQDPPLPPATLSTLHGCGSGACLCH